MEKSRLIDVILQHGKTPPARHIPDGTIFKRQGEQLEHIGIILSGTIFAQTSTKDGHSIWLEEFGPNQLIGIESIFSSIPLRYELIAKTNAKIAYYSKEEFLRLIQSHDEGLEIILKDISHRLIRNIDRIVEANTLTAKGRICAELKRHSKPIGIEPDRFIIRPIPVFSEFALRVGSTRESVSRTVSNLAKTGVILRRTGALIISDMRKLEAYIK